MAESLESKPGGSKENWGERGSRWLRNINALGAIAFGGVGI